MKIKILKQKRESYKTRTGHKLNFETEHIANWMTKSWTLVTTRVDTIELLRR